MYQTIFVVDDDPMIATLIRKYVKNFNFELIGNSSNARDAINKIKILKPDLIFMDVVIEGDMDGIDAANFIYDKYDIPIVFLTSYANDDTIKRIDKSSAFGFIEKPFSKYSLITIAKISIEKKKTETIILKQKESYINILENLNEAVISITGNLIVNYINKIGSNLTLWKQKDILNKRLDDMFIIKDFKTQRFIKLNEIIDEFNKNKFYKKEVYLVRHNSTQIPILLYLTEMGVFINDTKGYALFFSDISVELDAKKSKEEMIKKLKILVNELEETNKKFQKAQEEVISLEKTKAVLATVVAANHELNQPLMILQGNLELLKYKLPDKLIAKNEKHFTKMNDSILRIIGILKKFQDLKDIEFIKYSDHTLMVDINKEEENDEN